MNETIKKYGLWVGVGALVLFLVYRQMRGAAPAQRLLPPAPPVLLRINYSRMIHDYIHIRQEQELLLN